MITKKKQKQWLKHRHKNKRCDGRKEINKTAKSARTASKQKPIPLSLEQSSPIHKGHFSASSGPLWLRLTPAHTQRAYDSLVEELVPSIVHCSKQAFMLNF